MKILVIYDSNFGNTKKIAEKISEPFSADAVVIKMDEVQTEQLKGIDTLIVGCPTIAWNISPKSKKFFKQLRKGGLINIKAAAFDTRLEMKFSGNAARKIAKKLQKYGAELITESQRFIVLGKEGPLKEGEEERAQKWGEEIKNKIV